MLKKIAIKIIFVFCFSIVSTAQEMLPFVENFTKSIYNGDNQVWDVTQGNDNAMYFANNHFFLRYNGVKWEKYTLPNQTVIRAVFSYKDKIYCGSYNEFGYWKRENGVMIYRSLSQNKNLFSGISNNEEIWKIFEFDGKIYFQSFNELFILSNNRIEKIRIPFQISYCFPVKNKLYVASVNRGVFLLQNKKFTLVDGLKLDNTIIHSIQENNSRTYIFTKKNGVYIYDNQKISVWSNPLNNSLKTELIIAAKFIDKDRLVIGTAFKGLYVVNIKTNTSYNINRNNSLTNNSILNIGFDKENDLWLGMDNGIAHIEINSPYLNLTDNTGVLGSVYAMASIENGYLLGSNHGVFKYENKKLDFLENSQGQVWQINKVGSKYLIGHNDGTLLYENNQIKKINEVTGGWKFLKSNFGNDYFQANYAGIIVYKKDNFSSYKPLNNITKPIKNLAQNKLNEIWAVDNYKSLYKITFSGNFETNKVENITQSSGIKNDFGVKLFNYKSEILFYINNSWYQYDQIANKLVVNELFNNHFKDISEIIPIDTNRFVIVKKGLLYIIKQSNNSFEWELIPEKYYKGKIINQDTNILIEGNKIIFNLDDGFFSYEPKSKKNISDSKIFVEGFCSGILLTNNDNVANNQTVELNIIIPYFGYYKPDLFYSINSDSEIAPVTDSKIILNNLDSGQKEITIYSLNGSNYKSITTYNFSVSKPWYISFWMILLYATLISGSFFIYYRWNKIRYSEKIKLKEEELKHQKEILQLELDAENKLKIQEFEKHILEIQVQTKASEVAGKSLSIAKQTEMIEGIQLLLEKENDISSLKSNIRKTIKLNSINKKEWETFENNLFKSHEDFINRLTLKFPKLSSKDKKLCIYLKMNLTSKEIAPLMGISYRGVELHRYRLRKKLEIEQESNLSSFMNTI